MTFQRAAGLVRDSKVFGVNVLPEQPAEGVLCKFGRINRVIGLGIPAVAADAEEEAVLFIYYIRNGN